MPLPPAPREGCAYRDIRRWLRDQQMRAACIELSYPVALIRLRHDFVRHELSTFGLRQSLTNGGTSLIIEWNGRRIRIGHRQHRQRQGVLLVVWKGPHFCYGLFKELRHRRSIPRKRSARNGPGDALRRRRRWALKPAHREQGNLRY